MLSPVLVAPSCFFSVMLMIPSFSAVPILLGSFRGAFSLTVVKFIKRLPFPAAGAGAAATGMALISGKDVDKMANRIPKTAPFIGRLQDQSFFAPSIISSTYYKRNGCYSAMRQ